MKECIAFPGQGVQKVGMAAGHNQSGERLWEQASNILGFDLWDLCAHGPGDKLNQTEFAQPAITVSCLSSYERIQDRYQPEVYAGHSLGEVIAIVASGAISFVDGITVVKKRGQLMSRTNHLGGMLAILGLEFAEVEEICDVVSQVSWVEPANYNAPGQVVVSGREKGLAEITRLAQEKGAKRIVPLNVSGPFHSKLMEPLVDEWERFLSTIPIKRVKVPVLSNSGNSLLTEPADIKDELINQLTKPVNWVSNVKKLGEIGVNRFVEIGPNPVLGGLVRRINREIEVIWEQ